MSNIQKDNSQEIVSTDWTHNWEASLPVKITSIVLWGIAIIGFFLAILFLSKGKEALEKTYFSRADQLAYHVSNGLVANQGKMTEPFMLVLENQLKTLQFKGISFEWKGQQVTVGDIDNIKSHIFREILFYLPDEADLHRIKLTLEHPELRNLLNEKRRIVLMVMVFICVVFGFFLTGTLHKVVTTPIQLLVSATQSVSSGDLSVRLNIDRHDEFGQVAKFFNQMLDQIVAQQSDLREEISEHKQAKQALEETKSQAEIANKAKSAFLANMSHEIRTPLNAILGYAQIMNRNPNLQKNMRDAVKTIEASGHHLLGLINEILDISKIEAGRMVVNKIDFDLNILIEGLANMFQFRCEHNDLQWILKYHFDKKIVVEGDEAKLRQILINLVGNAVKFTEAGHVLLKVEKKQDDRYLFVVEDTGIGISQALQKKIYEPFQQGDGGYKKGGTGLGLAIAKSQIELLGGDLKMESALQIGTRFSFEIPLQSVSQISNVSLKSPVDNLILPAGVNVRALVVDDNRTNREILAYMLSDANVSVSEAVNGLDAVGKIKCDQPDIVFMDIRMPVMDGVTALREIKSDHQFDAIKFVAITASSLNNLKNQYLAAGFDDFISKPFLFKEVFDSISRQLNITFDMDSRADENVQTMTFDDIKLDELTIPKFIYEPLCEAAKFSQVTELKEGIDALERMGEKENLLANRLRELLSGYDMDSIESLLKAINN